MAKLRMQMKDGEVVDLMELFKSGYFSDENIKKREEEEKIKRKSMSKRDRFINRQWNFNSEKGTYSVKIKDFYVTIFPSPDDKDKWNYVYDDIFSNVKEDSLESAKGSVYDSIYGKISNTVGKE